MMTKTAQAIIRILYDNWFTDRVTPIRYVWIRKKS